MARSQTLLTTAPTNIVRQPVTIGHVQLRDLVVCPDERGVVNYVHEQSIMERNIMQPSLPPTPLVNLAFTPNTIASLHIPDSDERLLAAGGQDAELHLSIHSKRPSTSDGHQLATRPRSTTRTRRLWQYDSSLTGSINNSVLLTSLSLTRSHESSSEPRVAVSNNDCTVKFFDVNVRGSKGVDGPPKRISEAGTLRLDVPVNHSSISPDGRTLLSVGDSPHVYLHGLTGGARITFTPLAQLTLPSFDHASPYISSTGPASFSTAFSASGTKFAVASQEGMVAVWDVRSRKPMKVYQTDRSRAPAGRHATGAASGYMYEDADAWDWTRPGNMQAPGWGVRNVKFSPVGHGGREIMTFTEHTSLLHVVDATTFETEEIIRVPSIVAERSPSSHAALPEPTPIAPDPASSISPWTSQIPRLPPAPSPQPRVMVYNGTAQYRVRPSAVARMSTSSVAPVRLGRRHHHIRREAPPDGEFDPESLVMIPSLGDHSAERDVRRVLSRHGVRSTLPASEDPIDVEDALPEEGMDLDELESDCLTSRAGSPVQSQQQHWRRRPAPAATASTAEMGPPTLAVPPHLDIAGTCFDPTGSFLYVASTGGIVEWGVRGADKRWWAESVWA
ncbi:hypothetical protein FA95DRAFT_1483919 [Auriscalpium vulgare]|uniref:Uncharacterized protein n=1 Tax=Auriscalpium vulgare TaxID=40419 RepID=A0ACB8S7H3_9AGAM|nr:hypothetical protein FA95DRAFT_1483919 [Auriscalpium vulgare]